MSARELWSITDRMRVAASLGGRRPFVAPSLGSEHPAVRGWSFEMLAKRGEKVEVTAAPLRSGRLAWDQRHGIRFERVDLADHVRAIMSGASALRYVTTPVEPLAVALRRELPPLDVYPRAPYARSKLWVASSATRSTLHWDIPNNVYLQLIGAKRFTLVHPKHTHRLSPCTPWSGAPNFSRADPETPSFDVPAVTVELGPGDALYIPSGYWHHARSLGPSVGLNYWWGGPIIATIAALSVRFKRLRGLHRGEW